MSTRTGLAMKLGQEGFMFLDDEERAEIILNKIKALENQATYEEDSPFFNAGCPLDGQNEGD